MLILTGSLAYDFILNFNGKFTDHILPDKIHTINLSFLAEKLSKEKGGIAGNIGYNLALLGVKPIILSSLGEKDGKEYIRHLKKWGIETKYIKLVKNEFTANYIVVTDLLNNQIGAFYPGATRGDIKISLREILTPSGCANALLLGERWEEKLLVVISPGDPKAMEKFIRECQELNLPYLFDPGKQLPNLSDEILNSGISKCQILIANDYEMALIKKRIKFSKKLYFRSGSGRERILITTFGKDGSIIETKNESYKTLHYRQEGARLRAPPLAGALESANKSKIYRFKIKAARPKKVVDPVGAGDAYLGGFLAGFIKGFDLVICGQMGSVAAVYTVEKYGTQTHRFTIKEFCERYKQNFNHTLSL